MFKSSLFSVARSTSIATFVGIIGFSTVDNINAQNVIITTDGAAVIATGLKRDEGALIAQVFPDDAKLFPTDPSNPTFFNVTLQPSIESYEDLALDEANEFFFALSTTSRDTQVRNQAPSVVCAIQLTEPQVFIDDRKAKNLPTDETFRFPPTPQNCIGIGFPLLEGGISVGPFSGIAAMGGTMVISGGVGGVSVFRYGTVENSFAETSSFPLGLGLIDEVPTVLNQILEGVVGLPDVTMISSTLIAFSADVGVVDAPVSAIVIASISFEKGLVEIVRQFEIKGTAFENAVGTANIDFVNVAMSKNDETYLYTAAGIMTVVDPLKDGEVILIDDSEAPDGFNAVTVAVNPAGSRVYFGGLVGNDGASVFVEYDISKTPMAPTFVRSVTVEGRITSIAANDDTIVVASQDQAVFQTFLANVEDPVYEVSTMAPYNEVSTMAPPTTPINGVSAMAPKFFLTLLLSMLLMLVR